MKHILVPDVNQLTQHYLRKQQGGSLPGFRGARIQRGYGIGSFFKSIARFAIPLVKRGAQVIGKRALKGLTDVGQDIVSGKNVKQAIKDRSGQVVNDVVKKGVKLASQSGGGRKRKRPIKDTAKPKQAIRSQAKKQRTSKSPPDTPCPFFKHK